MRFLAVFLALVLPALAHPPYDGRAETLQRADGTTIRVVEYYVDGIIGDDPVSVQFRLPDDSVIASTGFATDVAIRHPAPGLVDVDQFKSTFIPIASRVDRFDGSALSDITSASNRWITPLIHTAYHWRIYLITLGVIAFLALVWVGTHQIPRRGWFMAARVLGFGFVIATGPLYLLLLLWIAPVSAPVLFILFLLAWLLFTLLRRVFRRASHATV